jgi:hypothetical protein
MYWRIHVRQAGIAAVIGRHEHGRPRDAMQRESAGYLHRLRPCHPDLFRLEDDLWNFAVSSIFDPFMMSIHICGAASISNDEASMVVTTLAADRLRGSNVKSASKRLRRVV